MFIAYTLTYILYVSMPGKRLSLVCCWGPAAFHFPGVICCYR